MANVFSVEEKFAPHLLAWYRQNARSLPWRGSDDPYAIWVSEVMLQQTRVETVIPYFLRWMERFPTLSALADAPEQQVLSAWEGLGYYSRARSLHKAAQVVMAEYGGQLPRTAGELEKLPGVGRYTAAAVASMAFGRDVAALDGNIRRVLARVFNVDLPARSPQGEAMLWQLAQAHLPPGHAGDYNQAIMDLGSAICTPRNPRCLICPLAEICEARQLGVQEQRPVLEKKSPTPHYTVTAAVIWRDQRVLICQRPTDGLLGGLWEFPGGKQEPGESLPQCLVREIHEELGVSVVVGEDFGVYRHAYTHFSVTLHAFVCQLNGAEPQALHHTRVYWATGNELKDYPMGRIDRQIAARILNQPVT